MKYYPWLWLVEFIFGQTGKRETPFTHDTFKLRQPASTQLMDALAHLFHTSWAKEANEIQVLPYPDHQHGVLHDGQVYKLSPSLGVFVNKADSLRIVMINDPHEQSKIAEIHILDPHAPICVGRDFYPVHWFAPRQYNEKEILRPLHTYLHTTPLNKEFIPMANENQTTTQASELMGQLPGVEGAADWCRKEKWAKHIKRIFEAADDGFLGGAKLWDDDECSWAYIRQVASQKTLELTIGYNGDRKGPQNRITYSIPDERIVDAMVVDAVLNKIGFDRLVGYVHFNVVTGRERKPTLETTFQLLRQTEMFKKFLSKDVGMACFSGRDPNLRCTLHKPDPALGDEYAVANYKVQRGSQVIAKGITRTNGNETVQLLHGDFFIDELRDFLLEAIEVDKEQVESGFDEEENEKVRILLEKFKRTQLYNDMRCRRAQQQFKVGEDFYLTHYVQSSLNNFKLLIALYSSRDDLPPGKLAEVVYDNAQCGTLTTFDTTVFSVAQGIKVLEELVGPTMIYDEEIRNPRLLAAFRRLNGLQVIQDFMFGDAREWSITVDGVVFNFSTTPEDHQAFRLSVLDFGGNGVLPLFDAVVYSDQRVSWVPYNLQEGVPESDLYTSTTQLLNKLFDQEYVKEKQLPQWASMPGAEHATTFERQQGPDHEPLLINMETGELRDEWIMWYVQTNNCTITRATVIGLQKLEEIVKSITNYLDTIKKGEEA